MCSFVQRLHNDVEMTSFFLFLELTAVTAGSPAFLTAPTAGLPASLTAPVVGSFFFWALSQWLVSCFDCALGGLANLLGWQEWLAGGIATNLTLQPF